MTTALVRSNQNPFHNPHKQLARKPRQPCIHTPATKFPVKSSVAKRICIYPEVRRIKKENVGLPASDKHGSLPDPPSDQSPIGRPAPPTDS